MKTVAAPIYFLGLLQSSETTIQTPIKKKKVKESSNGLFSRRTDVGRTGLYEDCGRPNFSLLHITEKNNTNAKKINKKIKMNLEKDLLAGGTDMGRTGHHEDGGCSNL